MLTLFLCLANHLHEPPMYPHPRINIAHRGASAYAPEHTLAAYRLALQMKADFVEPDLQVTKDGVLLCMHDTTLDRTTNVKKIFPSRSREVKGKKCWPICDFTLAEIKQLDAGSWFDAQIAGEKVPTLQEMIDLVKGHAGIIPETKSPEDYEQHGLAMEALLMETLKKNGLDQAGADKKTPVVIQSFSLGSLRKLKRELNCQLPLLLLYSKGDKDTFAASTLLRLQGEVHGIGPSKALLLQFPEMIQASHAAGLTVTLYTCRSRNPKQYADLTAEMKRFLDLGVDAIFTDNPDLFPR